MEGPAKELAREEIRELNYPAEELSFSVAKNREEDTREVEIGDKKKSSEGLFEEEEILKTQLTELKTENFSLRASISAWQLTLKNKLEEFSKADLKLNEIYNEIWSERENYSLEIDKSNNEYGILSEWWEKQMKFVSDLEKLEKETLENQKCQREINELEKQVVELKREIEAGEQVEIEMHSTQDGDHCRKEEPRPEDVRDGPIPDDQTEMNGAEAHTTQNEFFSIVDLGKVRMANRSKHRRCRNHFLTRVKKLDLR